jgi:hypothetical protein
LALYQRDETREVLIAAATRTCRSVDARRGPAATGFKLANQGVDTRSLQHYLGHKNIQHTVRYSELSPDRFRDFWKD